MSKQSFVIARQTDMRGEMLKVWNAANELISDERQGIEVSVSTVSRRSAEADGLGEDG